MIITGGDAGRGEKAAAAIQSDAATRRCGSCRPITRLWGGNQALADRVREAFPGLDVLVNNVGGTYATRWETADGYTGRRSGRRFTIPVGYEMAGLQVTITVGSPEARCGGEALRARRRPSSSLFGGRGRTGHAVATRAGDEALVRVALGR